ncbi:hypothetical protein ACF2JD_15225 [Aeromonas sp. A-5]|uniref:hypothetical protein n=1 Tax=Aeromonas ichthyocola TaxID=3367746 RepID=UPI0038EE0EAF
MRHSTKMARLHRSAGIQAIKWIRECDEAEVDQGSEREKRRPCPGSMLQTGMLLFSATCGATPVFGGLQRRLTMKKSPLD